MLLAIDTSTTLTGLACYDQPGLLAECVWYSGRNHTAHVLPQLQMLLGHVQRQTSDIQAVGVALGPGSWSGLRVGLSIAKGIAVAGGAAVLGIGTLDILAYQHHALRLPTYPLISLGRGRFATARFQYTDQWKRLSDYHNTTLEDLCATIEGTALFCGDLDADTQATIRGSLDDQARFPQPAANLRRAGYLAELAWQRWLAGERDSLSQLEPLYLGEPTRVSRG